MSARAIALPRLRVRRRKPPSRWAILTACWMVLCLAHVLLATLGALDGDPWQWLEVAAWIGIYYLWRFVRRILLDAESRGMGGPWAIQWVILAANVGLLVVAAS